MVQSWWTNVGEVYWSPELGWHAPGVDLEAEMAASLLTERQVAPLVRLLVGLREFELEHTGTEPEDMIPEHLRVEVRDMGYRALVPLPQEWDPVMLAIYAFGELHQREQVAMMERATRATLERLAQDPAPSVRANAASTLVLRKGAGL